MVTLISAGFSYSPKSQPPVSSPTTAPKAPTLIEEQKQLSSGSSFDALANAVYAARAKAREANSLK